MAVRDLEAFLRQAAGSFDPNMDTSPGSPFDNKVIQPLVRRLGIDPFTVDLQTFLIERLRQAYPKLATGEGDNITDLLVKPATLLWDPLVRENVRVQRNLSFADPTTLTLEEADSLGGTFFAKRNRGKFATGLARVYFASPQQVTASQNNFVTSRGGLVFFPTSIQSIRTEEMLLNVEDELYFFDVSVVAQGPGTVYNIDRNELVSIANLPAAVRVRNLAKFDKGLDEENAVEYAGRIQQGLGEKSLVTLRGISAKLLDAFPQINRLNVTGYGDPEMQRDVIRGGGLGPIVASGTQGSAISAGTTDPYTKRFYTPEADFDLLFGVGGSFVLTVIDATASTEHAVDIDVLSLVDKHTIDLQETVLILTKTNIRWMLRKKELTISGIPGGLLFPTGPNGTVQIPDGEVHIGGSYDTFVREKGFDEETFTVQNATDDEPSLSGTQVLVTDISGGTAPGTTLVTLEDYKLDINYSIGDAVDTVLKAAEFEGYAFQIQNGPNAGTYRILEYFPGVVTSDSPSLRMSGSSAVNSAVPVRWRLFDETNIDLIEPKETRLVGEDLVTIQGSDVVTTDAGTDLSEFGVAKGDILRILSGPNAGDYTIVDDPLVPNFSSVRVDRTVAFSSANDGFRIFRPEASGMKLPFVRVRSVELLDSSSQPQGSYVPYACPVDVQSRAFQNPARGVKHDLRGATLGIVSVEADEVTEIFLLPPGMHTLTFYFPTLPTPEVTITVLGAAYTVPALVAYLNNKLLLATGGVFAEVITQINALQFGVRPVGNGFVAIIDGDLRTVLFGYSDLRTTADVRTAETDASSGAWASKEPAIDTRTGLDVVQVVDGRSVGFYAGPFTLSASNPLWVADYSRALMVAPTLADAINGKGQFFSPDAQRRVLIGARSLGSVRVFFLEPTSFEVNAKTVFSLDTGSTGIARFVPDPTLSHQQIPAKPNGKTPMDGESTEASTTFTSSSQDFLQSGINLGDKLYIENHTLTGTIQHNAAFIAGAAGLTFIFSIDGGPDRTVVLVRDDPSIGVGDVTKDGVIEQINAAIGLTVLSFDGSNRIQMKTDLPFVVRRQGTANDIILGYVLNYTGPKKYSASDTSNESPHRRDEGYTITDVGQQTLAIDPAIASSDPHWPAALTGQTFRVERSGVQRVSTTQMASQVAEASLYYADIELVSEGTGDFWNIDAGLQLTVEGYKSDGYRLVTQDSNLTFSTEERPGIVISRTILEQGVDDDPRNATQITGQSLQVTYERSEVVADVQDYMMGETERVVCASPLSRHLVPHFVRFDLEYFGGSAESVVVPDIEKYISEIYPVDGLDASDLQKIVTDRGANKVTNPLTLIAVVHYNDRHIYVHRSQDSLSTGRLSAFIPDILNIKRNVTGGVS